MLGSRSDMKLMSEPYDDFGTEAAIGAVAELRTDDLITA